MKKDCLNESVIVIIPCLNAQNNVGHVVKSCKKYIEKILVIDDGSTDNSAENAKQAGAEIVTLDTNHGVGYALQTGFNIALERGYSTVITIDADGAHDPNDIPSILAHHIESNSALTVGNRWGGALLSNIIPSQKFWANRFASQIVSIAGSVRLPDVACGFRVIDNSLLNLLIGSNGFGFLYEMLFLSAKKCEINYSPVSVRYDADLFWITKHNELKNLLKSCIHEVENINTKLELSRMIRKIEGYSPFSVIFRRLEDEESGGLIFFFYPIEEYLGYQIQGQKENHISFEKSDNVFIFVNCFPTSA